VPVTQVCGGVWKGGRERDKGERLRFDVYR
jgi:hypothetical protein